MDSPGPRRRFWAVPSLSKGALVALAAGLCVGVAVLFVYDPARSSFYPRCLFRALTGLRCPGCGTARALHQLLHGNLKAALLLNPLTVLFVAVLGGWYAMRLGCIMVRRAPPRVFVPAAWIWGLLAVIVLFWVLRNLPLYPFSLFAS